MTEAGKLFLIWPGLLDQIGLKLTGLLQRNGYRALPIPASQIVDWDTQRAHVSHKRVAELAGLGSGKVDGYNLKSYLDVLIERVGQKRVVYNRVPTVKEISNVDVVLVCPGFKNEGEEMDRPFSLPKEQNDLINRCAKYNKKTIVIVTAGGGIQMDWNDRVSAVIHALYGGQKGADALMDISV